MTTKNSEHFGSPGHSPADRLAGAKGKVATPFSSRDRYHQTLLQFLLEFSAQPIVLSLEDSPARTALIERLGGALPAAWRMAVVDGVFQASGRSMWDEFARQWGIAEPDHNMATLVKALRRQLPPHAKALLVVEDPQLLEPAVLQQIISQQAPVALMLIAPAAAISGLRVQLIQWFPAIEFHWLSVATEDVIAGSTSSTGPRDKEQADGPNEASDLPFFDDVDVLAPTGTAASPAQDARRGGLKKMAYGAVAVALIALLVFQGQINQWLQKDQQSDDSQQMLALPEKTTLLAESPKQILPLSKVETEPTPPSAAPEPVAREDDALAVAESAIVSTVDISEPAVEPVIEQAAAEEAATQREPAAVESTAAVLLPEVKQEAPTAGEAMVPPRSAASKAEETAVAPAIRGAQWILDQPENHFALHLMSVRSRDNLLAYIRDHQLQQQAAYYRATRSSGTWYVLLYGSYSSRQQVQQGRTEVEKDLKIKDSYIRDYRQIQQDVRKGSN